VKGTNSRVVAYRQFTQLALNVLLLGIAGLFSIAAAAQTEVIDFSDEYNRVFQIRTVSNNTDGKASIGSGFQVSADGLIVTNFHVVSQFVNSPDVYTIEYSAQDGSTGPLALLDFDVVSDIAILQHPTPTADYFTLADSTPERGVLSYAIGNPGDWGMVMVPGPTNGFVEHSYEKRVLFSGSLNPGMSGGPSLNSQGQVIGVNVATAGSQLSFLVPAQKVRNLIDRKRHLKSHEYNTAIANQIRQWQQPRLQDLIDKDWPTELFFGRELVGEIRKDVQCWSRSNESKTERTIDWSYKSCSSGDDIYLGESLNTGQIEYSFSHRTPRKLNNFKFALAQGMSMSADNDSDFDSSTNYLCESDFLDQYSDDNHSYTRIISCVRAYKKLPGLFDSMLLILDQEGSEVVKGFISIAGAEKNQIMALNRKFTALMQ